MLRIVTALLVVGVLDGASVHAQAEPARRGPDSTAIAEVRAASLALDSAIVRGDTAALRRYYAAAYVHIDQYGTRTGKEDRLAEFARGTRRVQSIGPVAAERFAVSGDVVVASAQTAGQQTLDGQPLRNGRRMSTRVWVRDAGGQWQVLLAQVTPIVARQAVPDEGQHLPP